MSDTLRTNVWVILDEELVQIVRNEEGQPRKFKSKKDADVWASHNLGLWVCINMNFIHTWLQHEPNM